MRGRKRTPTAILKLQKSPVLRQENRRGKTEPEPPAGVPFQPAGMSPAAVRCWDQTVAYLGSMGLLASSDGAALAAHCVHYAEWQRCMRAIRRISASASEYRLLTSSMVHHAKEYMRGCQEFGLSPSARARCAVTKPPDDDELGRFLKDKV